MALRNAEMCAGLQMPPKLWPPFWKSFEREILPTNVPPVIDRDRSFFAKPSKLLFPNGLLLEQKLINGRRVSEVSLKNNQMVQIWPGFMVP